MNYFISRRVVLSIAQWMCRLCALMYVAKKYDKAGQSLYLKSFESIDCGLIDIINNAYYRKRNGDEKKKKTKWNRVIWIAGNV